MVWLHERLPDLSGKLGSELGHAADDDLAPIGGRADPDGSGQPRGEPHEPHVGVVLRRSGLARGGLFPELGAGAGARLDVRDQRLGHESRGLGRNDALVDRVMHVEHLAGRVGHLRDEIGRVVDTIVGRGRIGRRHLERVHLLRPDRHRQHVGRHGPLEERRVAGGVIDRLPVGVDLGVEGGDPHRVGERRNLVEADRLGEPQERTVRRGLCLARDRPVAATRFGVVGHVDPLRRARVGELAGAHTGDRVGGNVAAILERGHQGEELEGRARLAPALGGEVELLGVEVRAADHRPHCAVFGIDRCQSGDELALGVGQGGHRLLGQCLRLRVIRGRDAQTPFEDGVVAVLGSRTELGEAQQLLLDLFGEVVGTGQLGGLGGRSAAERSRRQRLGVDLCRL